MLASPEIVTAMAFAGRLDFNPITDSLQLPDGSSFKFNPPSGDTLPSNGFIAGNTSYLPDIEPEPQREVQVDIKSDSLRLQYLEPFDSPFKGNGKNGEDELELSNLRCLMRIRGKCTTDHISAAGPWLKYKVSLEEDIGRHSHEGNRTSKEVDLKTCCRAMKARERLSSRSRLTHPFAFFFHLSSLLAGSSRKSSREHFNRSHER